jgi:phosphoserine phosphatase
LLKQVDHPVAVNPDTKLAEYAQATGWPIISLRDEECPEHHFNIHRGA